MILPRSDLPQSQPSGLTGFLLGWAAAAGWGAGAGGATTGGWGAGGATTGGCGGEGGGGGGGGGGACLFLHVMEHWNPVVSTTLLVTNSRSKKFEPVVSNWKGLPGSALPHSRRVRWGPSKTVIRNSSVNSNSNRVVKFVLNYHTVKPSFKFLFTLRFSGVECFYDWVLMLVAWTNIITLKNWLHRAKRIC